MHKKCFVNDNKSILMLLNLIYRMLFWVLPYNFLAIWRKVIKSKARNNNTGTKNRNPFRTLFNKFLTPGLTCELCNPFDDWLKSISPTNHPVGCISRCLTRELKIWWIKPYILSLARSLYLKWVEGQNACF